MNIRKLMKEKVSRVSISSKMSIVMTVSIVLILTVFLGVNRYYNSFFVYQKLENASLTYLDSIDRMMENLVDTLDGYSRICFSNAGVQELLDKNSSGQVDFSLQDNVNNYLWELVVNVKQIESIYLYSNNGLVASADRQELHYPRYRWGGGFTKPFVEAGMVENLDPYVEDGTIDLDAMMPDICNNFYYDGSLYGLPLDSFIGVLMCNQSLFDEYGLEIPKTMDDLYAVSATFNENGITPIAMGEKDKWPGLFPFGALALRYGGVEKTITMLNGEGNFDQEFVQKTAEELQKMVDEGVFASDSVALTDDEATEEFRQGRAAMWYSGNWKVDLLCEEGSPLEGKLTMVNWPAVSGADGDQNSFVGGASATLVASATSAHKKEAVEFMTFMSEHFSNYAYEEGAILPTWKYSGDMELKPFQQTLLDLMQGADGFCLAWDTLLDPETADVHSTSLQGIYAQQMTADDYVEAMAATR